MTLKNITLMNVVIQLLLLTSISLACSMNVSVNTLKYEKKKYVLGTDIFPQADPLPRARIPYEGKWVIRNDSLFLIYWKPRGKFKKPRKKAPYFADWYSGSFTASAKKEQVGEYLYAATSIRFELIDGIIISQETEECNLTPPHLYSAARQAYYSGQYELAHDLFRKIYDEYPDYFKNDWVLLFLIMTRDLFGAETTELRKEHLINFSNSPSADFLVAKEILQSLEQANTSQAHMIDLIKDDDIRNIMKWTLQGYVNIQDLEPYLRDINPKLFQDYPRAMELYQSVQQQVDFEILPQDIPYIVLVLGINKTHLNFFIPMLFSIDLDDETGKRISAKLSKQIWNVPCDMIDSPQYLFENREIESIMRDLY